MRRSLLFPMMLSLLAANLTGCGAKSSGPLLVAVGGEIKLDGQPVSSGRILFRKTDGDQRGFSGEIANGRYKLQAEPGKMSVEIVASRPIPNKFDRSNGAPEPVGEMYIPRKYNDQTVLLADVSAETANNIPFELRSN